MNTLKFKAGANGPDLIMTVRFNNTVQYSGTPDGSDIEIYFDNQHTECTLEIIMSGKQRQHTKINSAGEIVEDQVISIDNIRLNDVVLGQVFYNQTTYYHSNNDPKAVELQLDQFYGVMGCNGTVVFKFQVPVQTWLMKNQLESSLGSSQLNTGWLTKLKTVNNRFAVMCGIDMVKFVKFFYYFPRYLQDLSNFLARGGNIAKLHPALLDRTDQAGAAAGGYFCQDLHVANMVYLANPKKHVTVGSVMTGFVAHVASFRSVHVMDIRPLDLIGHPNITFSQLDLMGTVPSEITDSLSCLSTLHHLGLGRYGGNINPVGPQQGLANLATMVETGGTLYVGVALNSHDQVIFNSGRSFHPMSLLNWSNGLGLTLQKFDYVDPLGMLHTNVAVSDETHARYGGFGIYTFIKN